MNKRNLTIDDLINFCSTNKFYKFNSAESGFQLAVKVPTTFEIDDTVDDNHRGMTKLKFRIFHSGLNRNGSYVSKNAADEAMKTIPDRPVLAAIHQLDDGTYDFEGHEMEVIKNENGEEETVYIESQVGSFSSEPAFWEHDDELDKDYVCAYAYISNEYTKTIDIIKRKNGTKNSCELCIEELSFNAKEKYLDLIKFYVSGSTLLGKRDDGTEIGEGMLGSRADIADFSTQNNSIMQYVEKLDSLTSKVDLLLSRFDKDNQNLKEGGNNSHMDKLNELLEKYNKTIEEINFEYSSLTDQELELKFEELFGDTNSNTEENDPANNEGETNINTDGDNNNDNNDNNDGVNQFSVIKGYELSHSDIKYALYVLLSDYEAADNEWYFIEDCYDTHFVYSNWDGDKIYGQNYVKDGDNVSFDGERYNLHRELLTDSEYSELQSMRSNYASLVEFKENSEKKELHSKREEVLSNKKFNLVRDTEAFKNLVKNIDNYSVDELEKEAKIIFADNTEVETENEKQNGIKLFTSYNKSEKNNRYGDLFNK